jgi:hypothetical protein
MNIYKKLERIFSKVVIGSIHADEYLVQKIYT